MSPLPTSTPGIGTAPAILPRRRDRKRILIAIIVVAILATFGSIITHDFVGGWDDDELIVHNPMINPPTAIALEKIWTTPHIRMYIPAVYSTWWLLAHIATVPGDQPVTTTLNPYAYHAANLLVHLISTLLVFAILEILLEHGSLDHVPLKRDTSMRHVACALGALLFGLHPLQVEPVAWATGMKDLLSGMFALAALWQYLESWKRNAPRRRAIHYALATLLFIIALLAKPSTVILPLIALALDGLLLRRSIKRSALELLPWFLIACGWAVLTTKVQPTPELIPPPLLQRPLIAANALGFYIAKLFWPARLGIDYGLIPGVIVHTKWWILTAIAITLVALLRNRWVTCPALVFAAGLLPVLGLTSFVFQWLSTTADRYVYLSMLGPAIFAAYLTLKINRTAFACAFACMIAALGIRSAVQCSIWQNDRTLMTHELTINPSSPLANNYIGHLAFADGRFGEATRRFAAAVQARPDYLIARDNLASALAASGHTDQAIDVLKQTLAIRRKLPPPIHQPINADLSRLAAFLIARGQYAQAIPFLRELESLSPNDPSIHKRLTEAEQNAATQPARR
jgi:Flp pilus assembly protein TadD